MSNCLFCAIVDGELKTEILFETDDLIVIKDKYPQAPTHLLVISKTHYRNIIECLDDGGDGEKGIGVAGKMLKAAVDMAKKYGFAGKGYRTIINTNAGGGQSVFHLHMHILAGVKLSEDMI